VPSRGSATIAFMALRKRAPTGRRRKSSRASAGRVRLDLGETSSGR